MQAKHTTWIVAVLATTPGVFWTGFSHAEGLTAQFTLGQRLQYTGESGVASSVDEGFATRSDLGVLITSETRTQTLSFGADAGLLYNFTKNDSADRFRTESARATLSYKLENRNSALEVAANYRRTDLDETAFIDDDLNEITSGGGRRETYRLETGLVTGREGPLRFNLDHLYAKTNFSGTTDTGLVDTTTQGLTGRLTFQINPQASVNVFASWRDVDAEQAGSNDRVTERVGVGATYAISPILTATAELSYDSVESDNNAGTVTTTDGIGYRFGLTRTLADGALRFNLSEEETANGKRRQASIGRDYTFKRGSVAFSLGVTKTDGTSLRPIASLAVDYELDKLSSLSLSLRQASVVNDDDETTINSRLGLTYARQLTELSRMSASLQVTDRNVLTQTGDDQTSIRLNLSHRYQVGNDWDLVSGVSYTRTERDNAADTKTSTVFVGLEKTFDFRP